LRDIRPDAPSAQALEQPENLSSLQSKQNRRILDPKFAALDAHQRIVPRKFAMAHGNHRHKRTSRPWR
jgi:hypothetical protein